eukprot:scaffold864_cov246-Chaetoceros_neogracile.AAC.3
MESRLSDLFGAAPSRQPASKQAGSCDLKGENENRRGKRGTAFMSKDPPNTKHKSASSTTVVGSSMVVGSSSSNSSRKR